MRTEIYEHHGRQVHVNSELKGRHRDICLCCNCQKFKPDTPGNCAAAGLLFALTLMGPITVAPVLECTEFVHK